MAETTVSGFSQKLQEINQKVNDFINFVIDKLKHFKELSRGEQVSYVSIGIGLFLILTSIILFII